MNEDRLNSNLEHFSKILRDNGTDLRAFLFNSRIYVEGIRKSISEIERYLDKPERVLDLGCGTGLTSLLLIDSGYKVDGIDVEINNPEMIEEFQKKRSLQARIWKALEESNQGLRFSFYDGVEFPFGDQKFDAVMAHAVLEHIPAENRVFVIEQIWRVLKPGGYFFLFRIPRRHAYAEYIARILRLGSHEVLMDEKEVTSILRNGGFEVICLRRTDMVFGNLPGKLQNIWNLFSPVLLRIDTLLLKTPINHFAHHLQVICRKK